MMEFQAFAPHRRHRDTTVPMINVVFLLLVFFMMTSQIRPAAPVEISPPVVELGQGQPPGATALYIDAKGVIAFADLTDAEALAAVTRLPHDEVLNLHVDAQLKGYVLAQTIAQLGAYKLRLVTQAAPNTRGGQ